MNNRNFSLSLILSGEEKSLFKGILKIFSKISDIALENSSSHSYETALLSLQLGRFLKLPLPLLRDIFYCGLLHDIGEICFDHRWIKAFPAESVKEKEKRREHPLFSAKIIQKIPTLEEGARYVAYHHEWYNGMGYPYGLKGTEIPLPSQIIAVADTYSINRTLMDRDDALNILFRMRGIQFNPEIVEAFLDMSLVEDLWSPISFDPSIWTDLGLDLIDMAKLLDYKGDYLITTLEIFSDTIDAKHIYTHNHSKRVAQFSELLGKKMGLPDKQLKDVIHGALLHDIGKIAIPRYILDKQTPLTANEWNMIQNHPQNSYDLVSLISSMENVAQIVRYHHERFKGGGYPAGLKGEDIPLGSRIVAIADAFDAITSRRPYNKGFFDKDYAYKELKGDDGGLFDPDLVALFMDIPQEEIERFSYKLEEN